MKKKQMTYTELKNEVEERKYRMTKWDVACFLIGYNKMVTESDWENIMRLYHNNIID